MKAVKLTEPGGEVAVQEVAKPQAGPGELLIKVQASGLCYTDVHICDGDWAILDGKIKRDLTLGHEAVGLVEAVGEGVTGFSVGDRVAAPFLRSACGSCKRCLQGRENHCAQATALGMSHDGSHADYVIGIADYVVHVPEALSSADAAPLVCAGMTVYGGLQDCGVRAGQRVCVIGVGGQGHYAIQIAKAMGAQVYALDIDPAKVALARDLGADGAFTTSDASCVEELTALELDVVIVTAPSHQAHQLALAVVSFGGKISLCAVPEGETPLSMIASIFKGVTYVSQGVATRLQLKEVLEMAAAGAIKSHVETRPLRAAPEAIAQLREREIVGRVVFVPEA